MDPAWARSVRDQCVKAGVPFFFKQWGNLVQIEGVLKRVGQKNAGRVLDEGTWDQYPTP
jgi:protein gp37